MKTKLRVIIFVICFSLLRITSAGALTIDFEGPSDSTVLTNEYTGVIFSNATVITSGITLNESEFPPHSGTNAIFYDGGAMTIAFSTPMTNVGAYFTYGFSLTLFFYDSLDNLDNPEGTLNSAFSSNFVSSGNPPNEFLSFASASGISKAIILGDQVGTSFVMDDLTFNPLSTAVPEPNTLLLLAGGFWMITAYGSRKPPGKKSANSFGSQEKTCASA
jgi:hypothetical protein